MNVIYRRELAQLQTNFLIKIKHTLLKRAMVEKMLPKNYSYMLVDVLGELDSRRMNN